MMADSEDPNAAITKAIKKQLGRLDKAGEDGVTDPETAVKIIRMAMEWEKIKHAIVGKSDDYDPEGI